MDLIVKIVIAILIFSVIIIFHEFGHFLLAKKNGIGVTEFSLGMGPKIWSFEKDGTLFVVRWLLFGGACIMEGMLEDCESETSFQSKSVWARMSVILAGPVFNFILAFVFALIIVGFNGWDYARIDVFDDMPAQEAGLQNGDVVKKINNYNVLCARDIANYVQFHGFGKDEVTFTVERDGKEKKIKVTPAYITEYDITGFSVDYDEDIVIITEIEEGTPFDVAGIGAGDQIVAIDGTRCETREELSDYLSKFNLNEVIDVEYIDADDGQTHAAEVTLEGSSGYKLGFSYSPYLDTRESVGALETVWYSAVETAYWMKYTVQSLGYMVRGNASLDDLSGPVGVVDFIGDAYDSSMETGGIPTTIMTMLYIMILLSANIGIMNLLPIPGLDGGRFVLLLIEAVRRKPVSAKVEGIVTAIGFIFLFALMIAVLFNDIGKLF